MNDDFIVERVALHLVDRARPEPIFAESEVNLEAFQSPDDRLALKGFFAGHLTEVWAATESLRTRAANFSENSAMRGFYQDVLQDSDAFFARSRDMAQRLYDVSRGLRTSPGLLMIMLVCRPAVAQRFTVLFKMEPGPADKITLRQGTAGQLLLDLAVQHIERALPDPGDRVLKWAVIPHPTRTAFDLKVKDKEGGADLAQYFVTFLGCETRPMEKNQAEGLLDALPAYAEEYHPEIDWKTAVAEVVSALEEKPLITAQIVASTVQELGVFPSFSESALLDKLSAFHAEDLHLTSGAISKVKLQYELPSGIFIRGPQAVMQTLVEIVDIGDDKEIRIRTRSYRKTYV